jgi:phage terminase small subunit
MSDRSGRLTNKQRSFVEEYFRNGCNGAAAYAKAYATRAGPQRRAEEAARLLRHPKIAPIICAAKRSATAEVATVIERYAVTQARVLAELARLAFSSMQDYVTVQPDGTAIVDLSRVDADQWCAVSELRGDEYVEGRGADARVVKRVRIKLHGKREALEAIARIEGYPKPERHEVAGARGGPIETTQLKGFGRELMEQLFLDVAERRKAGEAAAAKAAS